MQTQEQKDIIETDGNLIINATAGSGKTYTLIQYVKARPNKRFMYLVFNKSAKEDALKKFNAEGLRNVIVDTAHGLAYKEMIFNRGYKAKQGFYTDNDYIKILGLDKIKDFTSLEEKGQIILVKQVLKFFSLYCNSNVVKIEDFAYCDYISESECKIYNESKDFIIDNFKILWTKMNNREIDVTHDFYLKRYQLSNPKLNSDVILFDEGQDSSPVMLSIFNSQECNKIIVGDSNQQIYAWRLAENALDSENLDGVRKSLTTSFRFNDNIANISNRVLDLKSIFKKVTFSTIKGLGTCKSYDTNAFISRSNMLLLTKAIELVEHNSKSTLFFEGGFNSYLFSDSGSIFDILNLHNGKFSYIKDPLIKRMTDLDELEEYAEDIDDINIKQLCKVVRKYNNKIPFLIKKLREQVVEDKDEADYILTNVHKSKGMEYDTVSILKDYITEQKIYANRNEKSEHKNLNEEINLLYVAITRTKNILYIPNNYIPKGINIDDMENVFINDDDDYENEDKIWKSNEDHSIKFNKNTAFLSKSLKRSPKSIKLRKEYLKNNK